jgi:hypothetical protein
MRINADIIRKYSLEEVALLAMFAFGLLIAGLIVVRRSRIEMSELVELPHSGLSLSLPAGPGWERSAGWSYETSSEFSLRARLRIGNQLGGVVHCRYLLASPETDPQQVLTDRQTAATLQAARSGRIVNDVTVHWVQIADTFLGVAALDHGRMLEIIVKAPADRPLADKVFRLVAESIVFESDELISRGADFIRRFRSRGLGDIIQQQNAADGESIYLINDARDKPAGFQIETFRKSAERGDWSSVAVERIRSTGRSRFKCTDRLDRFVWQTWRTSQGTSQAIAELELAGDGAMQIRRATSSKELTYRPGDHAIAEMLIDRISRAFLDAYENEALIDLILADGKIIPAVISTVDTSLDTENKWGAAYSVRVRFLLGRDAYVQSYFDFEKNLVGKIEKNQSVLYWHKSDRKTLTETFPDLERYLGSPPVGR